MKCEEIKPLLTQYLLGDLDVARSAEVRAHIEKCGGCRAAVQEIEPTLDLLRDALAAPSAAPTRLSAKKKETIVRKVKNPVRKIVFWMTSRHPRLTQAAAIFVVAFTIWVVSGRIMWRIYGDMYRGFGKALPAIATSPLSGPIGPFLPMFTMGEVIGDEMKPEACIQVMDSGKQQAQPETLDDAETAPAATQFRYELSGESRGDLPPMKQAIGKSAHKDATYFRQDKSDVIGKGGVGSGNTISKTGPGPEKLNEKQPSNAGWGDLNGNADNRGSWTEDGAAQSGIDNVQSVNVAGFYQLTGKQGADMPAAPNDVSTLSGNETLSLHGGAKHEEAKQEIDLNTIIQRPKPLFIGTPVNLKNVNLKPAEKDAKKSRSNADWYSRNEKDQRGQVISEDEKNSRHGEVLRVQKPGKSSPTAKAPAREYEKAERESPIVDGATSYKSDSLVSQQQEPENVGRQQMPDSSVAQMPAQQFVEEVNGVAQGNIVDFDDKQAWSSTVMTKSPLVAKGLYGNRSKAGRESVLNADKQHDERIAINGPAFIAGGLVVATNFVATQPEVSQKQAEIKEKEEDKSGPRFKAYGVNPFVTAYDQPFSTFGIDCDTASYTLARNYMLKGYLPPAEAVRTEEFVNFFDYAYRAPERDTFKVYVECAPSKFGRGGLQMMKIGVKGRRLGREEQRQAVLTFLVDTSGSMEQPDRIGLVKKSLRLLVEKLNPQDLVSLVKYDSHAKLVLEHVTASEKKRILDAIDSLQCTGSTNLEEGMEKAYQVAARNFVSKGENRVLLMSDGVANLGEMAAKDILNKVEKFRRQGILCSVFGLGIGTYNDEMLQELANKGDGTYKFLDSEAEARKVFVDDLSANLNTIAKNVKIQVEFNKENVKRYRQIGYERRQLKKEDFRNDQIDAGEVGSGQSVTALYEAEVRDQKSEIRNQRLQRDVIATVRVRYQRVDNGQIEEIERPVTLADIINSFDKADVRFKLAVCAAQFAEILRGSPFAEGREFQDVERVLAPVALELELDGRVQELMKLVTGAGGLSRGQ